LIRKWLLFISVLALMLTKNNEALFIALAVIVVVSATYMIPKNWYDRRKVDDI